MAKMIFVEEDHNLNAVKNIADAVADQDAVAFHQLTEAIAGAGSPLTAGEGVDITDDVVSAKVDPSGGLLSNSGVTRQELAVKKQQAGALRSDANGMFVLHKPGGHTGSDNTGLFVDVVSLVNDPDFIAGTTSPLTAGLGIDITDDVVSVKVDPVGSLSLDNKGLSVDVADGIGKTAGTGALIVNTGDGLHFAGTNADFVTVQPKTGGHVGVDPAGVFVDVTSLVGDADFITGVGGIVNTSVKVNATGGIMDTAGVGGDELAVKKQQAGALRSDENGMFVLHKPAGHTDSDNSGLFVDVTSLLGDPTFIAGIGGIATSGAFKVGGEPDYQFESPVPGATYPLRPTLYFRGRAVGVLDDPTNDQTIIDVLEEMPRGGTTGQVLGKTTDEDWIVGWVDTVSKIGGEPDYQFESPVPGTTYPARPTLYFRGRAVGVLDDPDNDQTIIDVLEEMPRGGTTGQVLTKTSNTDWEITWADTEKTNISGLPPVSVADDGASGFTVGVVTGPGITTANGAVEADVAPTGGLTKTAGATASALAVVAPVGEGIIVDADGVSVDWTVVPPPTNGSDAVNKDYVDQVAQGMIPLAAVRAATTGPIVLGTTTVLDGVTLATGDRVLVKDQADPIGNGVFVKDAAGMTRAPDANDEGELRVGSTVFVSEGAVNANASFAVSSIGGDGGAETRSLWTPGVDPDVWVKSSQISGYTEGPGIDINGNVISVDAGPGLSVSTGQVRVVTSDGSITVSDAGIQAEVAPRGGLAKTAQGPLVKLDDDSGLIVDGEGYLRVTGTGDPTVPGAGTATVARTVTGTVTSTGTAGEKLIFTHGLAVPSPVVSVQVDGCEVAVDVCRPSNNDVEIGLGIAPAGIVFTVTVTG